MSHPSVDQFVPEVYDNGNSTLQYSGTWQSLYDVQIPSKAAPKNYTQTSQSGAAVALNFSGSAVAIRSPVNWGHWIYNVVSSSTVLPSASAAPQLTATMLRQTLDGVPQHYNASTFWLVGNSLLFFESGLDPSKEHEIRLINTGGAGMIMNLNDITVYTPSNMVSAPYVFCLFASSNRRRTDPPYS